MKHKTKLKFCLITILLVLAFLVSYKGYLYYHESDYEALNNEHIERIESNLSNATGYRFAVIGNIRNSMRIFEQRIIPLLKEQKIDFLLSLGNAVFDGAEDKYRLLYRGLNKSNIPYVVAVGQNELEDFGSARFYKHFGPYFFSFQLKNATFIFLDSTGKTSWNWQLRWLEQELSRAQKQSYRFVFCNHSPIDLQPDPVNDEEEVFLLQDPLRHNLQAIFEKYKVTAVFSAGYPIYHKTQVNDVQYIISGGGGGLHLASRYPYQFVEIEVGTDGISDRNVTEPGGTGFLRIKLETLKLFIHSFFYMSLFNALLATSLLSLAALKLYSLIIRQEHLYRDFSAEEGAFTGTPLRVAMFTNNYLPFIGGVPLSIDRLFKGLISMGHTVKIFAPTYRKQWQDPKGGSVFRCPGLFSWQLDNFPVTNVFSGKIKDEFKKYSFDLVHIHHPFWCGSKGMRLAKKSGIPIVFTYHTRLEHYTHYIPLPGTALKNLAAHFVIKQFANKCDAIITPTPSTEEYLRNLGVSTLIETIPTGISMEEYTRWSSDQIQELRNQYVTVDSRLLISVSRMAEEKNLDFLIDGLSKIKNQSKNSFTCLLVGDGPEKERLMEKVARLGLAETIVFTGNLEPHDIVRCYLAADIFVFASTSETQGMVLLEAMAGGCPVVAVRASGVNDVVKAGYNGFAVAESTDDWAAKIVDVMENDRERAVMSQNCRSFADNYSVKKIAERVSNLYRRVLVIFRSKSA